MPTYTPRNNLYIPSPTDTISLAGAGQELATRIDDRIDRFRHTTGSKFLHTMGMYEEKNTNLPGWIVVKTDLPYNAAAGLDKMLRIDVRGYHYFPYNNILDATFNMYLLNGGVFSPTFHNNGSMKLKDVRLMRHTTDNSLAVAFKVDIPATSDLWNYPKVVADAWISWGTEVPDAQFRTMTISRDNMLGAYALVHNFNDASWIPLPLVNGWVAYDTGAYSLPRYRRTGQTVEVQGLIKNGTVHAACAALPSGYQPDGGMLIFLSSSDTGNARVDVWEDGSLIARDGGNAWRSLNNIKFPVGGVQ